MKKVFSRPLVFLLLCAILLCASSCSFLEDLLQKLPEITLSPVSGDGTEPPPITTEPENAIPFSRTPEVGIYELPPEEFSDPIEKEASEIIDAAIAKAVAYVATMKDGRHSTVSFPFEEDAGGYIAALSDVEREYYRIIVEHAKKGEPFRITDTECPGGSDGLRKLFFNLPVPLSYCEPGISSYFYFDVTCYGLADYSTYYTSMFDLYFDPYRDWNANVSRGSVTMDEVKHGADLLDAVVRRVVKFMPGDLTAYDKYYYLAAVLSEQTSYDKRPANCFSAFGALIGGRAVCEGYAYAYYLLCREADLWCAYRDGLPDGQGHIWNMVKLESGIYNVDVTWCDGSGKPYERDWYDCFIKSDPFFEADGHCAEAGVEGTGTFEPSPYEALS
ncbi:MAG: hypothetical protein IJR89_08235 [Clostridia bacterium]|nr:hypothetical protein [Clostridia bacterium]